MERLKIINKLVLGHNTLLLQLQKLSDEEREKIFEYSKFYRPESLVLIPDNYGSNSFILGKIISRTHKKIVILADSGIIEIFGLNSIDKSVIALNKENYHDLYKLKLNQLSPKKLQKVVESIVKSINIIHDYEIIQISSAEISVNLYLPEIEIKNSLEMSHIMRECYIKFTLVFTNNKIEVRNLQFYRANFTPSEVSAGYLFSHTNTHPGEVARDFCFGDSELKGYMRGERFYVNDLKYVIYLILHYFSWESLEGVPYRRIENILPYKIETINDSSLTDDEDFKILLKSLIDNPIDLSIDFNDFYSDLSSDLSVDEEFRNKLGERIQELFGEKYMTYKLGEMEGKLISKTKETVKLIYNQTFKFKNQVIKPIIEESEYEKKILESALAQCTKVVRRDTINYVCSVLYLDYILQNLLASSLFTN